MPDVVGVIGAGLIGASIIARATAVWPGARIVAFDTSSGHRDQLAARFPKVELADDAAALKRCDLVFVCTPVSTIGPYVLLLLSGDGARPIVIDTGSVKAEIVRDLAAGDTDLARYVPGHPLAGSHHSGPQAANADIIDGRGFILTPTDRTDPAAVDQARAWLGDLGARVTIASPETHDAMLALTSHLPHVIAYALADAYFDAAKDDGDDATGLIAGSFKAQTVFAASDPRMWADILVANRAEVARAIDAFGERIEEFRRLALAGDTAAIMARIATIKDRRKAIGD